jgi:hypothetical protein
LCKEKQPGNNFLNGNWENNIFFDAILQVAPAKGRDRRNKKVYNEDTCFIRMNGRRHKSACRK